MRTLQEAEVCGNFLRLIPGAELFNRGGGATGIDPEFGINVEFALEVTAQLSFRNSTGCGQRFQSEAVLSCQKVPVLDLI